MRLSPSVPGKRKRSSATSFSSLPGYTLKEGGGVFQVALCTGWISCLDVSPDLSEPCDSHQRGHSLGIGKPSSLTSSDIYLCVNFSVSEFSAVKWCLLLRSSACVYPGTKELSRLEHRRVASETSSWQARQVSMVSGGKSHKHTEPLCLPSLGSSVHLGSFFSDFSDWPSNRRATLA